MSPFWCQCVSLAVLCSAFVVFMLGILPVRIFGDIPAEPVALGLTAVADIQTGLIGGFIEFFGSASNAERIAAFLVVFFSVLTIGVAVLWVMKKELPLGLHHGFVIVLVGPIAAAMTSLMAFATSSKLLERYSYADALASGYERNFVAPTVKSLKSKGLQDRRFVIYIPKDDRHLWEHLQHIADNTEAKEWKCGWDKKGYTSHEQTVVVGTQDGEPVRRTVLVVERPEEKYWVDFPRTLAVLTDVIKERDNECAEHMRTRWLRGFCKTRSELGAEYVDRFKRKLNDLARDDQLVSSLCVGDDQTCAPTLFGGEMGRCSLGGSLGG